MYLFISYHPPLSLSLFLSLRFSLPLQQSYSERASPTHTQTKNDREKEGDEMLSLC